MNRRRGILFVVLLAAGGGRLFAQEGAKSLDEAWTRAINANDLEAVVALYADDAVMFPPDAFEAEGKAAIRQSYSALLAANTVSDAKILESHSRGSGDVSTTWGEGSLTLKPKTGGEPQTLKIRFTSIAARRGGKWLYIVDHASAPLPPAPPAK